MPGLLGHRDEHLRAIESSFPDATIHVRGNEITIQGGAATEVGRPVRGARAPAPAGPEPRQRQPGPFDRHGARRRATERGAHARDPALGRGRTVRPKTAGQKRYVEAIRSNVITFGLGPAGTGKSWLAVAMAVQALQDKQVQRIILTRPAVEAGERLGFLPGDLMAKVDPYLRPLYDALYDMVEPRGRAAPPGAPDRRGRAPGLHAGPDAERELHHPRRGPEHHARADEDVPHPHRVRVQGRDHGRHHPGGRARRSQRPPGPRTGADGASTGSTSCTSPGPTWSATASSPTSSRPTSAPGTATVPDSDRPRLPGRPPARRGGRPGGVRRRRAGGRAGRHRPVGVARRGCAAGRGRARSRRAQPAVRRTRTTSPP